MSESRRDDADCQRGRHHAGFFHLENLARQRVEKGKLYLEFLRVPSAENFPYAPAALAGTQ